DIQTRNRARVRAGYPKGQRHELVSLEMIEGATTLRRRLEASGVDWELVVYLVSTHHGWARPLAPVVDLSDASVDQVWFEVESILLEGSTAHSRDSLDSGTADRFWWLSHKYG